MIDQSEQKNLLVFAHRGEAQQFFQEYALKSANLAIDLYYGDRFDLLICGEGVDRAMAKTAFCLGNYTYANVLNFGIAAACDLTLEKQKIYSIRTVYAHHYEMQFRSFPLAPNGLDCVSANERIFDNKKCEYLSHFAHIIDRELWGIANACDQLGVNLLAFKLISDYASNHEACENIKAQAKDYSLMLLNKYEELEFSFKRKQEKQLPTGFHFTESLLRKYESLKLSLDLKDKTWAEKLNFDEIKTSIKRPKTRTIELLAQMEYLLQPEQARLKKTLDNLKKGLDSDQLRIAYDKSLESDRFRALIEFSDFNELDQQVKKLKHFPIDRAKSLLNGETHVQ